MFTEVSLKFIAETILSEVIARGIGVILNETINPLFINLDRIEEKIERQSLVHLRAGMTFLKLGEIEQAVAELVRAEASDSVAPMPSFFLGLALSLSGRNEIALDYVQSALRGNPYLLNSDKSLMSPPIAASQVIGIQDEQLIWEYNVNEAGMLPSLRPPWWQRVLSDFGRSSAVSAISHAGSHIVLQCNLDGTYREWSRDLDCEVPSTVIVFDHNGEPIWTKSTQDTFLFATPKFVIFRSNNRYRVINIDNGVFVNEFSEEYFQSCYAPNLSKYSVSEEFCNRNIEFFTCKEIFRIKDGKRRFDYVDQKFLFDGMFRCEIYNKWSLRYNKGPRKAGFWSVNCQAQMGKFWN